MKIKELIFLGAGSSIFPDSNKGRENINDLPLKQANLFRQFFKSFEENGFSSYMTKYEHETILDGIYERLRKFFQIFFGLDVNYSNVDSIIFPTFEEVLATLEIAIDRDESYRDYGLTIKNPLIKQIREDLIFLIALVIDENMRTKGVYHRTLLKRYVNEGEILQTAFISLNYDIIIDNALIELQPKYDLDIDYGINFTNYSSTKDNWKRPRPGKSIYLFKPHGSLNWLYCPTCVSLTLTPKEKSGAKLVFQPKRCKVCTTETVPIIIPPTFFKVTSNFYLQQIWRKIERTLTQVDRIYFCGYSFPDADMHIKYLLKRCEVNRGKTPEIFVINGFANKPDFEKHDEEKRYKRFFKDSSKVNYTDLYFEDFCRYGISNS